MKKVKLMLIWIFHTHLFFDFIIMRLPGHFYKEVLTARICRSLRISKQTWQEMAEAFRKMVPVAKQCGVSMQELSAALITYTQ